MIHNGSKATGVPVNFNNSQTALLALLKKDLFSGINILTVFDDNQRPILERLYFNGFNWKEPEAKFVFNPVQKNDSVEIKVSFGDLDTAKKNSLSVAVLPQTTIASNSHHSFTSFCPFGAPSKNTHSERTLLF